MAGGFMRSIRKLLSPSGGGGLDLPDLGMKSSGFDPPPEPTDAGRLSETFSSGPSPTRGLEEDLYAPEELGPGSREFEGLPAEQYDLFDPSELRTGVDRGLLMEDPIYKAYTTNNWRDRRPLENRYRRGYRKFDTAFNKLEGDTRLPVFEGREDSFAFPHHPNQDPRRALLADVRRFEETGDLAFAPSTQMQLTEQALNQALRTREMTPPIPTRLGLSGSAFDPDAPTPGGYYKTYMGSIEDLDPPGWDIPDDGGAFEPDLAYDNPQIPFEPLVESPPSRPLPTERHLRWPELLGKTLYR